MALHLLFSVISFNKIKLDFVKTSNIEYYDIKYAAERTKSLQINYVYEYKSAD